jgi:DNA-damage-inducible protein J
MIATALANQNMTAEVRTRVSPQLKTQATAVLADCGLNVSDAVRLFLRQVVTQRGLPFEVKVPNATSVAALQEGRRLLKSKRKGQTPKEFLAQLKTQTKCKTR